jgi:predicted Zn-dependent protease
MVVICISSSLAVDASFPSGAASARASKDQNSSTDGSSNSSIDGSSNSSTDGSNSSPADMNTADKDERVYNIVKQAQPLISEKKYVEARKLLKEGALLDPTSNSGNLHASLAYVAHQLGDPEGAIAESQLAMKFDPRFVDELTWNVAMAYKDLGQYGTAREWLQKYLDTNPSDPKRKRDAEEFYRKLGEQENSNSAQSVHGPDYLDALVTQRGVGRWSRSSFPLKIYIEKSDNVPGVPEDSTQMLEDSFDAWNKASGGMLPIQQVPKAKQADITIQWTNNPSKVSAHDGVHLEQGITRVMAYQSPGSMINTIKSATIILLTVSRDTGQPLPADELRAVCLHEVGHALGLGGHSANSADTMYFSSSARQLPALSHRDKTTISRLYSFNPVAQNGSGMSQNRPFMPPFLQSQSQPGSFSQVGFPQRNPYLQRNMQGGYQTNLNAGSPGSYPGAYTLAPFQQPASPGAMPPFSQQSQQWPYRPPTYQQPQSFPIPPAQYGQQPYAQPQYAQPSYGQQPYGQPPDGQYGQQRGYQYPQSYPPRPAYPQPYQQNAYPQPQ